MSPSWKIYCWLRWSGVRKMCQSPGFAPKMNKYYVVSRIVWSEFQVDVVWSIHYIRIYIIYIYMKGWGKRKNDTLIDSICHSLSLDIQQMNLVWSYYSSPEARVQKFQLSCHNIIFTEGGRDFRKIPVNSPEIFPTPPSTLSPPPDPLQLYTLGYMYSVSIPELETRFSRKVK